MVVWTVIKSLVIYTPICGLAFAVFATLLIFLKRIEVGKRKKRQRNKGKIVGFFHPYCNAGGGGERVLWCGIRVIQLKYPNVECIVYTGDCDASAEDILHHAKVKFNVELPKKVQFFFLKRREWVEARHYPFFTLLGQAIGSMVLAYEALNSYVPDVYFDSMGYPLSYFIFKTLAKCDIGCYVHYPTISSDMLSVVSDRTGSFNNRAIIAKSALLTKFKLLYYHIFAWMYGCAGRKSDVVMVNSTWTKGHIENLWGCSTKLPIFKVFPPCDVKAFLGIPLARPENELNIKNILSISQFRPEKNQKLQVRSFAHFLAKIPEIKRCEYQLTLAGGCRNEGDKERVEELVSLARQLGISENVHIKVNVSFTELKHLLASSHIGIHTMNDEHFGIGVVEFQAAGAIVLAHNSGGPRKDIVIEDNNQPTGFLARTVEEYSEAIGAIFSMSSQQRLSIAQSARNACERFSEAEFEKDFLMAIEHLI